VSRADNYWRPENAFSTMVRPSSSNGVGMTSGGKKRRTLPEVPAVGTSRPSVQLLALVNQAAGFLATGSSPGRIGNRHPSIAPYETLRCEDGLIAVAAGNDRQFYALVTVLGLATLVDDPRFATNPARVENREALRAELEFALSTRPVMAWEERLHAADVPCGRVNDIGAAIEYAAELGLDPVLDVGPGRMPQLRNPVTLTSASPVTPHHQPHWASTPTKSSPGWPPIRTNRCLHSAALWPSP
jgi:crotonobetainyl-CoA:carnitine CoA-transferase CaiB-like acyl-CoA transferase